MLISGPVPSSMLRLQRLPTRLLNARVWDTDNCQIQAVIDHAMTMSGPEHSTIMKCIRQNGGT